MWHLNNGAFHIVKMYDIIMYTNLGNSQYFAKYFWGYKQEEKSLFLNMCRIISNLKIRDPGCCRFIGSYRKHFLILLKN